MTEDTRRAMGLGLRHLSAEGRKNAWKPFLYSFLVMGGIYFGLMGVVWWVAG